MEVDAVKKPEPLSKEQKEWLDAGKCICCGKHSFAKGQKCHNPKYKGFYEINTPKGKAPAGKTTSTGAKPNTTRIRSQEEQAADKRAEYLKKIAELYDREHAAPQASTSTTEETTARIVEIPDNVSDTSDFLPRM